MDRMAELAEILNRASKAYYTENNEIMSNFEYDALYDELLQLEAQTGVVLENSPSKTVGFDILDSLKKVTHESRMLSLDKTKEVSGLKELLGENKGVLSWKLDGLKIVMKFENGKLTQAITRGNGEIGEDVTHNAKHFKGVPKETEYKGTFTVIGEALITYSEFEKINAAMDAGAKYKNPRNLCSGTVRQLNSGILKERQVVYIVYSVLGLKGEEFGDSKAQLLDWAKKQGFNPVEYVLTDKNSVEEDTAKFKEKIAQMDLPSDGLVLSLDSISLSESLGTTAKFPRDSIALKWEDEIRETKLLAIEWNTSRTGLINPVAIFEPVELEGTTVNRASLHNLSIVRGMELGAGDRIKVYKANMIIPQLAENLTRSNTFEIPESCNVCGGETFIDSQNGVEVLRCDNPYCKAKKIKSLTHFVSRDAMNIEGFSEATIEKFTEKGFIENYYDIFFIEKYKDEIINMDGFGEKSANNLLAAIEQAKKIKLANFIYALGIDNIGLQNAKLMCRHFGYDMNAIMSAKSEEFEAIDGFGKIMAQCVTNYFGLSQNKEMAEKTLLLLEIEQEEVKTGSPVSGKTFVVTGSLNHFENRGKLQEFIEERGGKVSASVSAKTHYLINNDTGSNSSKNKKARELGIEIINEEDFLELAGELE